MTTLKEGKSNKGGLNNIPKAPRPLPPKPKLMSDNITSDIVMQAAIIMEQKAEEYEDLLNKIKPNLSCPSSVDDVESEIEEIKFAVDIMRRYENSW